MLNASRKYKLRGWVYIEDGSTITIPAGTVIRGDKQTQAALIIERGGQIFARGTASKPIVFTSEEAPGNRRPGDWGGLILCGRASNNKGEQQIEGGPRSYHGGGSNPVDTDNSGVLSYVRVEFAGFPFQTDKEINGITFGSVGSGTTVDHLQVSYSNDDSFEWFGGSVGCKYLVAYHGWDDDFDTDNGFSGNLQFLLGVRDPRIADKSLSNGFESDNNSDGSDEEPYTTARFCNVTLIGPMGQDAAFYNQSASTENPGAYINAGEMFPNNGSGLGQFQAGVQIRRNSRISLYNSIVTGWPVALMIEKDKGDSPRRPQQACSKSVTSTSRGTTKHSNRSTTRQSIRSSGFFRPTKTRHGSRGTASRTASCSGKAMPTSSTTRSTAWDWRNPSARARASIPGQAPAALP